MQAWEDTVFLAAGCQPLPSEKLYNDLLRTRSMRELTPEEAKIVRTFQLRRGQREKALGAVEPFYQSSMKQAPEKGDGNNNNNHVAMTLKERALAAGMPLCRNEECKQVPFEDPVSGDVICAVCGLVLGQRMAYDGNYERIFQEDDDKPLSAYDMQTALMGTLGTAPVLQPAADDTAHGGQSRRGWKMSSNTLETRGKVTAEKKTADVQRARALVSKLDMVSCHVQAKALVLFQHVRDGVTSLEFAATVAACVVLVRRGELVPFPQLSEWRSDRSVALLEMAYARERRAMDDMQARARAECTCTVCGVVFASVSLRVIHNCARAAVPETVQTATETSAVSVNIPGPVQLQRISSGDSAVSRKSPKRGRVEGLPSFFVSAVPDVVFDRRRRTEEEAKLASPRGQSGGGAL